MIREAFLMMLKPGSCLEYERRHNPIWPELETVLKEYGVTDYSIFLDRGNDRLFAYAEIESEERWQQMAQTEVCRHWWEQMKGLMLTNRDGSPVTTDLKEVFHID